MCLSRDDLMFVIRYVCLDIGGSDPERMAAPRVEEYIQELFGGSTTISVSISYDVIASIILTFLFSFSCLFKSKASVSFPFLKQCLTVVFNCFKCKCK